MVMPRRPKVKIGEKYNEMKKVTECTIEQRLISKNPYIALEEDKDIICNEVQTNSVSETVINDTDSNRTDHKHSSARYCTSTKEQAVVTPPPLKKQRNITYKIKIGPN
jgi:hypothetical protein